MKIRWWRRSTPVWKCGILTDKVPGLDAVSFGPDLVEIHSTRERMSIASVERTWRFVLGVLAAL